ncbi:MAG: hypothetical protein P4L87_01625 [Formivibrio sp.]|nr:hypothetical protein [Formivibrio sp.]
MNSSGYMVAQVDALFTMGKDYAFSWVAQNPDSTKEDLIEYLSQCRKGWSLSADLFDHTVRMIADRAFSVRSRYG